MTSDDDEPQSYMVYRMHFREQGCNKDSQGEGRNNLIRHIK